MENRDKPNILYHYTTQEGLKGILSEKSIWATKIQYLNDASELHRPLEIAGKLLLKEKEREKDTDRSKIIIDIIVDIDSWRYVNICVASFCKNGDLLSQWRGYGIYGSAYSIGFNTNKIEKAIRQQHFELCKCLYYDEKEYSEEIERFVLEIIDKQSKYKKTPFEFLLSLIKKASSMKLNCFQEEDEWRMVVMKAGVPPPAPTASLLLPVLPLPLETPCCIFLGDPFSI